MGVLNITLDVITGCINGDRRCQHDFYKESYPFLMSICKRYVPSRDDAEDLLNIGFLKILSNLSKYKAEVPFGVWMRRVMVNVVIDEFRKSKKLRDNISYVDEYVEDFKIEDLENEITGISAEEIYRLIAKLPTVSQNVFNLFVIDDFSHKEIAERLKIAEGTSKWHVNFARQKLKEMISAFNGQINVQNT